MRTSIWAALAVAVALGGASSAVAGPSAADRAGAGQPTPHSAGGAPALSEASFRDPPLSVRPMYRWWLPLAAVDDAELRREIGEMFDAGAGGIEIDPMPVPGELGKSQAFLSEYGFGTPRWSHALETIYRAGKARGLKIDFMASALYPTTVPTVSQINNPAVQQKLVFAAEAVQPGAGRDGPLPQPETPAGHAAVEAKRTLLAAVVAQCTTAECPVVRGVRKLDPTSARDVTAQVDAAGRLRWSAPPGGAPWWLLAFYQTADGQTVANVSAASPNYVIDHLGVAGARALTDFYDSSILTPQLKQLMRAEPAASMFEDSFEPGFGLKWTWGFLDEFAKRRGYPLALWLPALTANDVGARRPSFDFPALGERVREDYRQTWSDLYVDHHTKVYNAWLHRLGLKSRMQVEGGPMEMADVAAAPDTPEGENRNFLNNPELWKVLGVGAQLRGREALLSTECCPVTNGAWATTAGGKPFTVAEGTGSPNAGPGDDATLNWVYKAYAGGVNQLVWHGFPYITTPPGTGERARWPGNSFDGATSFAESYGPRMPQWPDYRAINDHLARLQLVLRQGRPVYDVVVFWHDFGVRGIAANILPYTGYPGISETLPTTSSLDGAGYTYQYLGPQALDQLSPAEVRDGRLAPDKLDAGALILYRQTAVPVESLRRIRDLARTGHLPVVVVGPPPSRAVGLAKAAAEADAKVKGLVGELQAMAREPGARVAFVDDEAALPAALAKLGVEPSVVRRSSPGSSDVLAVRRRAGDTDYYFLFNQSKQTAVQTLAFAGGGQPLGLDTWSGKIEPLGLYEAAGGRVSFPVRIAANDVAVIAIRRGGEGPATAQPHAIRSDAQVRLRKGRLLVHADRSGGYTTELSDGRSVRTEVKGVAPAVPLEKWTLQIESWTPDASGEPGLSHTARTRLAPIEVAAAAGAPLPSWTALGHGDAAGVGVYTTTVDLPANWSAADGACLDLGAVVDTFRVLVNGKLVAPSSPQDTSCIDLGLALRAGRNQIVVRVATPLRNAVVAATGAKAAKLATYGLIGPVMLKPYREVALGSK